MAVEEALYESRRPMHHTRSHSFASLASPRPSGASAVMMAILPVLSISTRAICTPAAVTALTALVTSCCRNVEGARAMAATRGKSAYRQSSLVPVCPPQSAWQREKRGGGLARHGATCGRASLAPRNRLLSCLITPTQPASVIFLP